MDSPLDLKEFLASLRDLSGLSRRTWNPGAYSLARMESLVGSLQHPERRYPSLHVAGTNGKGSVCVLASAALQAQGYRVGLYTSPHLEGPLHGIHLDGRVVAGEQLHTAWEELYPHVVDMQGLTVFETVTALAFQIFADQGVDVAVIETGLGGRLDATNVIVPAVSVITPIDLEHTHILGDRLTAIAAEKSGIIKPGVPCVMAPQEAETAAVLLEIARQQSAPLIEIGVDVLVERLAFDTRGQHIRLAAQPGGAPPVDLHLNLLGAHQALNAAAAFAALQQLGPSGLPVEAESLRRGFATVRWPGRLELLPIQPPILLDGAHTPAAARALAQALEDHFPGANIVAIFGASEDKALQQLVAPLADWVDSLFASQSRHPRALPAERLQRELEGLDFSVAASGELPEMMQRAVERARYIDGMVLVFGSVFLVEEARASLP